MKCLWNKTKASIDVAHDIRKIICEDLCRNVCFMSYADLSRLVKDGTTSNILCCLLNLYTSVFFAKCCFVDGELWSNTTYNTSSSTRKSAMCNFETTPVLCAHLHKCVGEGTESLIFIINYSTCQVSAHIECLACFNLETP